MCFFFFFISNLTFKIQNNLFKVLWTFKRGSIFCSTQQNKTTLNKQLCFCKTFKSSTLVCDWSSIKNTILHCWVWLIWISLCIGAVSANSWLMLQDQTYFVQCIIGFRSLCAYNDKYVPLRGVYRKAESFKAWKDCLHYVAYSK